MPERFFSKIEKPDDLQKKELPDDELSESPEEQIQKSETEQEAEQQESVEEGFAKELENTPKGGFRKKLFKILVPFILAGELFLPREGIAPQSTEESKGVYDIDYTREHQPELYKKVLDQIREKGGIITSPQLPEMLYRPLKIAHLAKKLAEESQEPFYNKPEVILGEKFVKENPEKTKEYMEKISTAIKATVRIEREDGMGSGVIVKIGNKKIIITNAHVCRESHDVKVIFNNNDSFNLSVAAKDEKNDIAMINIPETLGPLLTNTEALELEKKQDTKDSSFLKEIKLLGDSSLLRIEEKVASVGNPLGFPFAVGICKRTAVPGLKNWLFYYPDERFKNLELYDVETYKQAPDVLGEANVNSGGANTESEKVEKIFQKTGAIPGMSGGPIISLDKKGKPQLIGIVTGYKDFSDTTLGFAVPAEKINDFLKEKGMI